MNFTTISTVQFSNSSILKIIGTSNVPIAPKKIQYLVDNLVPDNIHFYFPKYKEFIRAFFKYLDLTSVKTGINFLNNININHVYKEFIDDYFGVYLKDVVNLNKYGLTDENKIKFLKLSRVLHNLKGNRKSFDFLFRTLTDIVIANENQNINIDRIFTEFVENENWWDLEEVNYYNDSIIYDGLRNHNIRASKPFTYQFKVDQSMEMMVPLIRSVHPAGFDYEFLIDNRFIDQFSMTNRLEVKEKYYHFYSYGEEGKHLYTYNGAITHSEYHEITTII